MGVKKVLAKRSISLKSSQKEPGLGREVHSTHTDQQRKGFAAFFLFEVRKMRLIRIHNLLQSCSQLLMGIEMLFSVNTEPILWAFTMFICRFAVPLSLLFLKRAYLNCYYLPHNYNLNENEVVFRHVQSTLIQKGFYSHFYCKKAVESSSGRKGTHGFFLSVQPQMCQSSEINDAISGISCCIIFGSSQQFGKMGKANHHRERFCYAFFNQ